MIALYQPHNILWLLPVTLLGAVFFMATTARRGTPGKATPAQIAFWCMAAGGIVGMIALKCWDSYRLREELRAVSPEETSHVTLARDGATVSVDDPASAARLLELLGDVKCVAAHHSHPTNPVTVTFEAHGDVYSYRIGRDSAVPYEFWVTAVSSSSGDLEVGRLQTAEWDRLVNHLLEVKK